VVREKYGRRGRSGDPEYTVKSLLVRNLEHLSPAQLAKVMDTLGVICQDHGTGALPRPRDHLVAVVSSWGVRRDPSS